MEKELDRRSFLKVTALTGAALFIGDIFPSRGFAQSTAAIPESEKIIITVITDNLADATRPHYKIARRHLGTGSFLERALHAEHGLSYHVETTVNGQPHQFLFDFATDFQGVKRNIDLLKIDFKKIEALALSHDHFDHQAALVELLKAKQNEIPKGIPFYVGEQIFVGTYIKTPDGNIASLLALKREDIESLGLLKIVETRVPTPIVPGAFFTGKVERVTEYEKIPPHASLAEALTSMTRSSSWRIADAAQAEADVRHYVEFEWALDTSQLPRPLQIGLTGVGGGAGDWSLGVERRVRLDVAPTEPVKPEAI